MNEYLKCYKVKLHVLSPVHIGSGTKIGKKEYIYMPWNHQVIIPDIQKMYAELQKKHLEKEFETYMLDTRTKGLALGKWLSTHKFQSKDYDKWTLYQMDAGEAFANRESAPPKEIDTFVKDAYGMPYVPGSSIKGMIRTALISWEIQRNPEKYEKIRQVIMQKSGERANRKQCLLRETKELEKEILYTLNRCEKSAGNAVNDNLSGLHVGDSEPISLEQLTLSQKIDYSLDYKEKPLPLLREALIPGTEICFEISIDSTICPYDMDDIIEALNCFQKICYQYFYSRFRRGTTKENIVWIGGGCGFLSKTIVYSLLGKDAVRVVDNIYKNTLGPNYMKHKHSKDISLRLAPHVCKCTKYQGKLYDMGMAQIVEYEKI